MNKNDTKVTVGIPLFNGEQHGLEKNLASILEQDYENIEVIISDNASTDRTGELCLAAAARDPRIRYYRHERNLGLVKNAWRLIHLCTTPYFKFAEHGDFHKPSYISACMKRLLEDESIVLCYPRTQAIHENGESEIADDHVEAMSDSPVERYLHVISELRYCNAGYGIYRTPVLREIKVANEECRGNDVAMLAEIALKGKIAQIEDVLYVTRRDKKWSQGIEQQIASVYRMLGSNDPRRGITFPFCRMIEEHLEIVRFSKLNESEKVFLYRQTLAILGKAYYPRMRDEIKRAVELIHQRRLDHNWGDPNDGTVRRLDPGKQDLYFYYSAEILKRFEEVFCVCPQFDEPGIHYARSICLTAMGRFDEAVTALRMELSRFPGYERAQRQLSALEQVLARR
ncbi:MAG: glycosyltransferase family 2 protein [Chitinispirillaceae bacterium]|nr:glycosyltransferase family 2 protein [Chitinispirillaceae bacterium]